MAMLHEIRQLFEYDRWANRRMFGAVEAVPEADRRRELGGSFPSLHATVAHILAAEWVWLQRWTGSSPEQMPAHWSEISLADLAAEWRPVEQRRIDYVRDLTERRLDAPFRYRSLSGAEYESPLWQSMLHVVNHSTYHRGQVTLLLRQLGADPVPTDLILFFRETSAVA